MSKRIKQIIAADMTQRYESLDEAVLIDFSGLTAEESRAFRATLRQSGFSLNVIKNTIARRVFLGRGIEFTGASLVGPTAVIWGETDALSASKAVAAWRKKNRKPLALKGGLMEGRTLTPQEAEGLTKMPSVQELKQMLVNVVAGPLIGVVGVTGQILGGLPNVLKAIADKKESADKKEGADKKE
ncbi:MAG: 50S ribosomal protein L10, partial [Planctomycetota bacterium]